MSTKKLECNSNDVENPIKYMSDLFDKYLASGMLGTDLCSHYVGQEQRLGGFTLPTVTPITMRGVGN